MFIEKPGVIYDQELFRRDVRRDVRNCSLFLFLFYGINALVAVIIQTAYVFSNPDFVSSVRDSLVGAAGGTGGSYFDFDLGAVAESMDGNVLALMSITGMVIGGCTFLIYRKKRFFTDVALPAAEPLSPKILLILVIITQGVQSVYGYIVVLIDYLLPEGLSIGENYSAIMENLFTPLGFVYIILIGPVFEELIFRGAVMGSLRRFGSNFAILFSSILFGFFHAVFLQIPFAFVMGLLLGYTASRWSLRAAILLHMIVNGLSCLFSVQSQGHPEMIIASTVFMLACAVVSLIMAIVWRDALKFRIRAGAAYYQNTYAHGFSSIAFWIFVTVMTLIAIVQLILF